MTSKTDHGEIPGRPNDYFSPPHGGRPPSDEAVREATRRYVEQEKIASAAKRPGDGNRSTGVGREM